MAQWGEVFGCDQPVALVTGSGAPRVGRAVLELLAARGCRAVVHANRACDEAAATAQRLRDAGVAATHVCGDLTDESTARRVVRDAAACWGRLDVVVNAAAIWERKPLEAVTADDVRRHFEVNAMATFVTAQEAGLLMVAQPSGGVIINVGDWAVARPYVDYAAYFPSKGAVESLTRSLAVELAQRNPRVRVNAVLPGPVMLPPDLPQAERDAAIAGTLVKREGTPRHVAEAVLALVENDFITGVCLPVDGGRRLA